MLDSETSPTAPNGHGLNDHASGYTFVNNIFDQQQAYDPSPIESQRPAITRSLDTLEVQGDTIDRVFSNFFARQHEFLPILDPNVSPNAYYEQSRFLFWAIMGVGCQSFTDDPTLFLGLSPKVNDLAMETLKFRDSYIDSIKGLLLLLTWPMTAGCPADTSFTVAGMFGR